MFKWRQQIQGPYLVIETVFPWIYVGFRGPWSHKITFLCLNTHCHPKSNAVSKREIAVRVPVFCLRHQFMTSHPYGSCKWNFRPKFYPCKWNLIKFTYRNTTNLIAEFLILAIRNWVKIHEVEHALLFEYNEYKDTLHL